MERLIKFFIYFNRRNNTYYVPVYLYIFWYTTDISRKKNDIPRISLEYECIFCGFPSFNPFPYTCTAKLMFVGVKLIKLNKSDVER